MKKVYYIVAEDESLELAKHNHQDGGYLSVKKADKDVQRIGWEGDIYTIIDDQGKVYKKCIAATRKLS